LMGEHLIIEWDVTLQTFEKFKELMICLSDYAEESDEYAMIREEIEALPGCPTGYDPDDAHIVFRRVQTTFSN